MKPNFALGLTEDGITLWQRGDSGWLRVGAVPMDAGDIDAQMQALVAKARALAPDGIATKLVIPDDQILYTDMPTQQDDHAIRAALEGKTPYPIEELEFDWQKSDGTLRVAVVARETLTEAEEFARAQGLNPVCFVAAPQSGNFATEPFFGRVDGVSDSPEDLGRGGPILRETGLAKLDKPTPAAAAKTGSAPAATPETKTSSPTAKTAPPLVAKDKPAATPAKAAKTVAKPEPDRFDFSKRNVSSQTLRPAKADAAKTPTVPAKAPTTETTKEKDFAAPASFRSRRVAPGASSAPATPPSPKSAPANKALTALAKSRSLSLGSLSGAILAERLRASVATPVSRATSSLRGATSLLKSKTSAESKAATPAQAALARADASKPAPKAPAKSAQSAKPASSAAPRKAAADSEADRLTVFGARRHETVSEPKLPRRALAISGAALLLVVAVVVWVFYFTGNQEPELAQPVLPEDTASDIAAPEALALPGTDEEDPVEAALGVTDAAQQQGSTESVESTAPEGVDSDDTGPAIDAPAQSAGRLAALRSVRAIPPNAPGDLPSVQGAPAPFGTAPLPPLRGAEVPQVTDENDLAATEPTLPPGEELLEISVTQGRPAVVPPARPEGLAPEPEPLPEPPAEEVAPQDESAVEVDVTEGTPPILPPTRPEDIAPEPPANVETGPDEAPDAETPDDQASLTPPPGGVALTLLAPRSRPAEIVERAVAQAEQFASATPQAVAASLRPSARPGAFSQIVERTLATARIRAVAEPQAEIVQASAASAAPRIPSSASVTRAATQTRAINLRQINLLGVMGTPSARRALVRLDNGRVVTVEVGERLDGGEVTAIGESELRYNKRGRDVVLRIAS